MNMDLNDKAEMTVIFLNHGWTECLFAKICIADEGFFPNVFDVSVVPSKCPGRRCD
jgi:hypothetical protein